jgi:hypothetical protein
VSQLVPWFVEAQARSGGRTRFSAVWGALVVLGCGTPQADSDQIAMNVDAGAASEPAPADAAALSHEMPDAHQEQETGQEDCPSSIDALLERAGETPTPRVQCGLYSPSTETPLGAFECFHQQAFEKRVPAELVTMGRCGVDSCGDKQHFVTAAEGGAINVTFRDIYGRERGRRIVSRCEDVQMADGVVSCVGSKELFDCRPGSAL